MTEPSFRERMTFFDQFFDKRLCDNLKDKFHFQQCLPLQADLLPMICASFQCAATRGFQRDVLCAAPTGSGKTLCYLLPVVDYLLRHTIDSTLRCVIVSANKGLCQQIEKVCALNICIHFMFCSFPHI